MIKYKYGKGYKIPIELFEKIRMRDKECVYCHREMKEYPHHRGCPSDKATIEHMDGDSVTNPQEWNVAICCHSCNASRKKDHRTWFASKYCLDRHINESRVSEVVREYMRREKTNPPTV
jgi:hypothetical protein